MRYSYVLLAILVSHAPRAGAQEPEAELVLEAAMSLGDENYGVGVHSFYQLHQAGEPAVESVIGLLSDTSPFHACCGRATKEGRLYTFTVEEMERYDELPAHRKPPPRKEHTVRLAALFLIQSILRENHSWAWDCTLSPASTAGENELALLSGEIAILYAASRAGLAEFNLEAVDQLFGKYDVKFDDEEEPWPPAGSPAQDPAEEP